MPDTLLDDPLLFDDDDDESEDDEREIEEHWARVAATPWHERNLLSVEELLTAPVSWQGRVVFYALPIVLLALLILL